MNMIVILFFHQSVAHQRRDIGWFPLPLREKPIYLPRDVVRRYDYLLCCRNKSDCRSRSDVELNRISMATFSSAPSPRYPTFLTTKPHSEIPKPSRSATPQLLRQSEICHCHRTGLFALAFVCFFLCWTRVLD